MKTLEFNPYINKKRINKRKLIIALIISFLLIFVLVLAILYNKNDSVKDFLDEYFFKKNISFESLPAVNFNSDDITAIYGYDRYIALLNKNSLTAYSSYGKKEFTIDLAIGTPIADTSGQYLVIGEKNSHKIYLVSDQNIVWQKDLEGEIVRLSVNRNGYVTVIVTGTTKKNTVITIDPTGSELFYTYFSDSIAIDSSISNDNKYLAIAEINSSDSYLQSNIKIISMDYARTDPTNSIVYIYPANSGEIISYIKYQDKGNLVCMYDTSIHIIQNKTDIKIADLSSKNDLFADIHLKNHFARVIERSSGIFSQVVLEITDVNSKQIITYPMGTVPKSIITNYNIIAVFYGTEIDFVTTSGWLSRKYHSSQEIKDIVIGSNIAGIIYKDKLEILNL